MHFYLRHPVHGTKVAISDLEMAADLEHGWEEFDPLNPEPIEEFDTPVNNLDSKRRRKAAQPSVNA
jgi:hypothetical protein